MTSPDPRPGGARSRRGIGAMSHQHFFHAIACHFGQYGNQEVHYHPCAERVNEDWETGNFETCDFALLAWGRTCERGTTHLRVNLAEPETVAAAIKSLRPEPTTTDDVGLCMGYLPERKRPAIWIERDGRIDPLAYFRDEEAYARFKAAIGGRGLVQAPSESAG